MASVEPGTSPPPDGAMSGPGRSSASAAGPGSSSPPSGHLSSFPPPPSPTLPPSDLASSSTTSPPRTLTALDGLSIVLALQIGSGIFASPALVLRSLGSEPLALAAWALCGALAWAGAACYAELGGRMPLNGGPQEYLSRIFAGGGETGRLGGGAAEGSGGRRGAKGSAVGFVVGQAGIWAVKPCSAAVLALFVAEYLGAGLGLPRGDAAGVTDEVGGDAGWAWWAWTKGAACVVVAAVGALNCWGNRRSSVATQLLLACKIVGVGFVLVMGLAAVLVPGLGNGEGEPVKTPPGSVLDRRDGVTGPGLSDWADAMLQAMYAYSGWETLAYIGGELQNPQRTITFVLHCSMAIVAALSMLANLSYFSALTFDEIVSSTTVGLTFSVHFLGQAGGALYAAVICLSTLGTLNAKTFTYSRLTQAAAERGFMPALLRTVAAGGRRSARSSSFEDRDAPGGNNDGLAGEDATEDAPLVQRPPQKPKWLLAFADTPVQYGNGSVPVSAIIFNSLLTATYVLCGDFTSLIIFNGIVEYSVVCVTLVGLLVLRLRERNRAANGAIATDTYRVPFVFILVALLSFSYVVLVSVLRHPVAGAGVVLFCAVGIAVYRRIVEAKPVTSDAPGPL